MESLQQAILPIGSPFYDRYVYFENCNIISNRGQSENAPRQRFESLRVSRNRYHPRVNRVWKIISRKVSDVRHDGLNAYDCPIGIGWCIAISVSTCVPPFPRFSSRHLSSRWSAIKMQLMRDHHRYVCINHFIINSLLILLAFALLLLKIFLNRRSNFHNFTYLYVCFKM